MNKTTKKISRTKYRCANDPWQTVTILGPVRSRKGKYINWVNVSNGVKSWSMDWSDPVNNDIIPNDKHEDNTLLPSNREAKKVFFKPNS